MSEKTARKTNARSVTRAIEANRIRVCPTRSRRSPSAIRVPSTSPAKRLRVYRNRSASASNGSREATTRSASWTGTPRRKRARIPALVAPRLRFRITSRVCIPGPTSASGRSTPAVVMNVGATARVALRIPFATVNARRFGASPTAIARGMGRAAPRAMNRLRCRMRSDHRPRKTANTPPERAKRENSAPSSTGPWTKERVTSGIAVHRTPSIPPCAAYATHVPRPGRRGSHGRRTRSKGRGVTAARTAAPTITAAPKTNRAGNPRALARRPPVNGAATIPTLDARLIPASFAPRSRTPVSAVMRVFHGRKNSGMYAPYRREKSAYIGGPRRNARASCIPARHPSPATIVGVAGTEPTIVIAIAVNAAANAAAPNRAAIAAGGSPSTSWRKTTQNEPVAEDPNARRPRRTRSLVYRRFRPDIRSRRPQGPASGEQDHEEADREERGVHGNAEGAARDRHRGDDEGHGARRQLEGRGREDDGEEPPPPPRRVRARGRGPGRPDADRPAHGPPGGR